MADTFNKKALQQKRAKRKKDKLERREDRKTNNDKGKSLEEMTVYLDEYGNLTNVHPDNQKRKKINVGDIQLGAALVVEEKEYAGTVSLFFMDKGYGFITEDKSRETVFVHINNLMETIIEKDRVTFEKEKTPKGFAAVNVRKLK
ncbi:MAG: cold shock domain-containing protein [Sphingobacteriales bacterium]|nr:MAG: cold shock domain-containing protein [Sphingobacteriales bacterium]